MEEWRSGLQGQAGVTTLGGVVGAGPPTKKSMAEIQGLTRVHKTTLCDLEGSFTARRIHRVLKSAQGCIMCIM